MSKTIKIKVSPQSERLLEQLAEFGIYGTTKEEVAARFVDRALQRVTVYSGSMAAKALAKVLIPTGKLRKSLKVKKR